MSDYQILSKIESPEDLKGLSQGELAKLAEEIRAFILDNVSKTGGHLGSNLGVVELTIALHRVFNSPDDKFIFDVGHQCYTHKIITGRRDWFPENRKFNGMSGFTRRYESPHDIVDAGHASTSVSSALGILLGEELKGEFNYIIPVIGDAALTGGMAYEALNHLGHLKKKMIVILNDNNMSIDSSVGAISSNLSKMTATKGYQAFKKFADWSMLHIPFIGKPFYAGVMRWKRSLKSFFYKSNIFTDLGLKYIGPIDGHNIVELEGVLERVKLLNEPVLLHVITKKGKGYKPAESSPGKYHGVRKFDPLKGLEAVTEEGVTYTKAFTNSILKVAENNPRVVAITAAMMSGTGLTPFFQKYPNRSFDVGITEEHAVTMAAGLAISGIKPVVSIYSTFIQRSIDQILHDVSIPRLGVIFTLDRAGIVPADGEAHQGLFDIPLLKCVPGMTIMAPSTEGEMYLMLEYAMTLKGPSVIRYAKDYVLPEESSLSNPLVPGEGVLFSKNGSDSLIITYGELVREAKTASGKLEDMGIPTDVYSMRFLSEFNSDVMNDLIDRYSLVIILEDGVIKGSVGEEIKSRSNHNSIYIQGVDNTFLPHGSREDLKRVCGIDSDSVVKFISGKVNRREEN